MKTNEFIEKNNKFWKDFNNSDRKGTLLIEEPASKSFINHCLAVQSLIINSAKSYKPLWIYTKNASSIELLKSYVPSAEYVKLPKLSFIAKLKVKCIAKIAYFKILRTNNILSFYYDKIKYGDLIYDMYLAENQVGTIQKVNSKIYKLIKRCIIRHEQTKKIIQSQKVSALLVSHRIGIHSGVLLRTALRYGCKVYSSAGMHRHTLYLSRNQDEIIRYEYSPTIDDIEKIISLDDEEFNNLYNFIVDYHMDGKSSLDTKFAFSAENNLFTDRTLFADKYNLDTNKKNIFVMMHAFTDHPHSHFDGMLFNDYSDWFLKTLEHAKENDSVNWIFKRHPSDKFYPTKDIDFNKIFADSPKHVKFLDHNDKLDARSLIYISDAIITCLGSAGFEMPAMGAIPAILASDSHYSGLGFGVSPKTQNDYFEVLANLENIEKITPEEQKAAKAAYMFIYYLSTVDMNVNPILSMEDHHNPNIEDIFYEKTADLYETQKDLIISQIHNYIDNVSKSDFKAVRTSLESMKEKVI